MLLWYVTMKSLSFTRVLPLWVTVTSGVTSEPVSYAGAMENLAFAMIYNTITGNTDAVEENGEAVRLYQNFWRFTKENMKRDTNLAFHLRKM